MHRLELEDLRLASIAPAGRIEGGAEGGADGGAQGRTEGGSQLVVVCTIGATGELSVAMRPQVAFLWLCLFGHTSLVRPGPLSPSYVDEFVPHTQLVVLRVQGCLAHKKPSLPRGPP